MAWPKNKAFWRTAIVAYSVFFIVLYVPPVIGIPKQVSTSLAMVVALYIAFRLHQLWNVGLMEADEEAKSPINASGEKHSVWDIRDLEQLPEDSP
jgi:hypothetical protein